MSFYPSLEDLKVDQISQAQTKTVNEALANYGSQSTSYPALGASQPAQTTPYPLSPVQGQQDDLSHAYPSLSEYMGLEFTQEMIAANMPQYLPYDNMSTAVSVPPCSQITPSLNDSTPQYGMVAPLSGSSVGLHRAQVTHGVRQVTLCKDAEGKVGIRVKEISKGIFICLVKKNSPSALAGLRFGDQILQINDVSVAGFSMEKVHGILRKCSTNGIQVVIRDRPFERVVTLHKDSTGHVGFHFKEGQINALVKDSSAARNGLLIDHHLLEVNGQNVIGLKDKDVIKIMQEAGNCITVTIMPSFIHKHMMKHMASSLTKFMDHSIPDL